MVGLDPIQWGSTGLEKQGLYQGSRVDSMSMYNFFFVNGKGKVAIKIIVQMVLVFMYY